MTACPSETTLSAIGTDALGPSTLQELEDHVEGCPDCQGVIERLARHGWRESRDRPGLFLDPDSLPAVPGFVVETELGRGSSGVVYLAREVGPDREVALKIVPGGALAGPRGRARWIAEARAVSRVRHPNVVQLYRVDETPEWLVLVFEYIPGGTLKDRLDGPLAPREAARLMERVALAVEHIHRRGLLHLDLKPSNILLDGDDRQPLELSIPKISDFGIARVADELAGNDGTFGGPKGTPSYMAPEQAVPGERRIGPATDVFALGALLYHLLIGRPPFESPTVIETIDKIRREEPIPPRRLDPRIPPELETICLTCLRKAPEGRYDSAGELAADLRNWLDGRPIAARAPASRARPRRWLGAALLGIAALASLLPMGLKRAGVGPVPVQAGAVRPPQSLQELRTWIRQLSDDPQNFDADRLDAFLRATRQFTTDLRRDPTIDADLLRSLAILQRGLAGRFLALSRLRPHAGSLYDQSLELLDECLRRRPDDPEIRWELALTLSSASEIPIRNFFLIGSARQGGGSIEDYLALTGRSLSIARSLGQRSRRRFLHAALSDHRRSSAANLVWVGFGDKATRILEADLAMFDSLDASESAILDLRLRRSLASVLLRGSAADRSESRALLRKPASDWEVPGDRARMLREWLVTPIARAVFLDDGPFSAREESAIENGRRARLLFEASRRECRESGFGDAQIPAAMLDLLTRSATNASAALRRLGLPDRALRVERRFMACTEELVRLYPNRVESQLTLSEAYVQVAKNAWYRMDHPSPGASPPDRSGDRLESTATRQAREDAIEAIRNSLEAARKAASMAPGSLAANALVIDRERRLAESIGE